MTITSNTPSEEAHRSNGPISTRPWPQWRERAASPDVEGGCRLGAPSAASKPLISYVTVTKNAEQTLDQTIRSVIKQKTNQVEHIIIDGRSTDGTLEIIKKYEREIEYYISEKDGGLYEAINKGIELSRGGHICILNAGDWLTSHAVQTAIKAIQSTQDNHTIQAFGAWKVGGPKNKLWPPRPVSKGDYLRCADLCHNSLYVPRHAYETTGPYDTTYQIAADFKWIMAAFEQDFKYATHRRPTVFYKLGGISANGAAHAKEAIRVMQERFKNLTLQQASSLYTRFHTFESNKRDYGEVDAETINQTIEDIISLKSSLEELNLVIEDAIRSERLQENRQIANKHPKKRLLNAFEKLIWRAID